MVIWGQLVGKFMARLLILLEPSTCAGDSEGNPFGSLAYAGELRLSSGHKCPKCFSQKDEV